MVSRINPRLVLIPLMIFIFSCNFISPRPSGSTPQPTDDPTVKWQEEFNLESRKLSDTGEAKYFILNPGFQTILASDKARLIITVLNETMEINGISTRVVEEWEEKNGELAEISRNYFAIDQETGDVFYFGEEVDFYQNGQITGHKGEWLAYENDNRPGLIMPGTPVVGMMYYQELAPGAAMDRAEVISTSETYKTPAGEFDNCLITKESSKIELATEYKTYCPGIGLVQDQSLLLVSYGNQTSQK